MAKTFIFHGFGGSWYIYIYIYLEPKWPLFLKVKPPKTRPFPIKTRVIWVPSIYIFVWRVQVTGFAYRIFFPVIRSNSNVIGFTKKTLMGSNPSRFCIWVFPKIGGVYPPKWMVVYNGSKPYWKGRFGSTSIFGNTHITTVFLGFFPLNSKGLRE